MGLELLVAVVSELHDAIACDARNDDACGGECKEKGFRFLGPSHDLFLSHYHLSLSLATLHLRCYLHPVF